MAQEEKIASLKDLFHVYNDADSLCKKDDQQKNTYTIPRHTKDNIQIQYNCLEEPFFTHLIAPLRLQNKDAQIAYFKNITKQKNGINDLISLWSDYHYLQLKDTTILPVLYYVIFGYTSLAQKKQTVPYYIQDSLTHYYTMITPCLINQKTQYLSFACRDVILDDTGTVDLSWRSIGIIDTPQQISFDLTHVKTVILNYNPLSRPYIKKIRAIFPNLRAIHYKGCPFERLLRTHPHKFNRDIYHAQETEAESRNIYNKMKEYNPPGIYCETPCYYTHYHLFIIHFSKDDDPYVTTFFTKATEWTLLHTINQWIYERCRDGFLFLNAFILTSFTGVILFGSYATFLYGMDKLLRENRFTVQGIYTITYRGVCVCYCLLLYVAYNNGLENVPRIPSLVPAPYKDKLPYIVID